MRALSPLLLAWPALAGVARAGAQDWPQWRGPGGSGATASEAPAAWREGDARWVVALPGDGVSTPIVVGERVLVTAAVPRAPVAARPEVEEPDPNWRPSPVEHDFVLLCVDRPSGGLRWSRVLATATPVEPHDPSYGSHAAASPASDGGRVVVSFGPVGLFCLDLEGQLLWSRPGDPATRIQGQRGGASSPVVRGDTVVLVNDHEGDSSIVALDLASGAERWRRARTEPTGWSTPLALVHGGRGQVVTAGVERVRAYALDSGELLWHCAGVGPSPIPSVVAQAGVAIALSGGQQPRLLAIELGHGGDLTGTRAVRWTLDRGLPYTPSPVVFDGRLFLVNDRGLASCYELASGAPVFAHRRLPRGTRLKASPIVAAGVLLAASESGEVHAFTADAAFEHLGSGRIEDAVFVASPVAAHGDLVLRDRDRLFCFDGVERAAPPGDGRVKLLDEGERPRDCFGGAVALGDGVAAVGAKFGLGSGPGSGCVALFERGSGWTQVQRLGPGGGEGPEGDHDGALFGHSLALGDGLLLVGAPGERVGGVEAGAVHAFVRDEQGWRASAVLAAPAPGDGDRFGDALALAGRRVLVGAQRADVAGAQSGAAFVFEPGERGWEPAVRLAPDDARAGDNFGAAVALGPSGDGPAFVAADHRDEGRGVVFVFERAEQGWRQVQALVAPERSPRDFFGRALACGQGVLLAGELQDAEAGADDGLVQVFERDAGGVWRHVRELAPAERSAGGGFGLSLALEGRLAAVGERGSPERGAGAVHLYRRGADGWEPLARLAGAPGAADRFGQALALSGGALLVGADRDAERGPFSGAAFVLAVPD